MPPPTASLCWHLERVEDIGNLPIAESLDAEVLHLCDIRLLAFAHDLLAIDDSSSIGKTIASSFVNILASGANWNPMDLEVLQNSAPCCSKLLGDLVGRQSFYDVFLTQDFLGFEILWSSQVDGLANLYSRKSQSKLRPKDL